MYPIPAPALVQHRLMELLPAPRPLPRPTARARPAGPDVERRALRSHHLPRMEHVLDHIEAHLPDDLGLERLADLAAISPFHFHRLFHAWAGETLKEFVRRRRLESAAGRLRHCPDERVTTVSLNCGFASPEAFARAFRERFGMTPTHWRAGGWTGWRPPAGEGEGGASAWRIELKHHEAIDCLYMRQRGDYGRSSQALWARFMPWVESLGLAGQPLLVIGLDDPAITSADNCRMDACAQLPHGWRDPGLRALRKTLPARWCACLSYDGPAADIGAGWDTLLNDWLRQAPFSLGAGNFVERYDPSISLPGLASVRCELCMPVQPRGI